MSVSEDEPEVEKDYKAGAAPPVQMVQHVVAGAEVRVVTGGAPPAVVDIPGAGVAALRVSPDAVAMLRWLDGNPEALPQGPVLLLELGCGAGLLGLACATMRPEATLVLTDVAPILPYAERSVAANEALSGRALARPLPFGDVAALDAVLAEFEQRPVVALGAGIFYWECVYEPLLDSLVQLCHGAHQGTALLGYFRRDWKVERRLWTKLMPQRGLAAEVLWEGEVDEPDDASAFAPACTRTPGEWNARVYRVFAEAPSAAEVKSSKKGGDNEDLAPWLNYGGAGGKKSGKRR